MVVTTPPTNVPVVDASTALALGSQGQHSSSLSHALWVSVLNQFFGLSSDAIASEPIQMLLKEPLIVEASTNFAIGCQRYHDSLLKYQQVKLTKQRDRLPSKSTTEKEGDVAKLEADTTVSLCVSLD